MWDEVDGPPKAITLGGSWGSWPVGVNEARSFPCIVLVEGSGDCIAGHHFIWLEDKEQRCPVVTLLGSSVNIPAQTVRLFHNKRIRLYPHLDEAGRRAAERWADQLVGVAKAMDIFDFEGLRQVDGCPVQDLNDVCNVLANDFEEDRELWRLMPYE